MGRILAETMPTRHRGWSLVLVGGIGATGGYFAASALSALLQPMFGWRIMWFLNLPTGIILVALSPFMPRPSPRGSSSISAGKPAVSWRRCWRCLARLRPLIKTSTKMRKAMRRSGQWHELSAQPDGLELVVCLNFVMGLWLPCELVAEGNSVALSSAFIAKSTLLAAPTVLVAAWLYSAWSTKGALLVMAGITGLGLGALLLRVPVFSRFSPVPSCRLCC